VPRRAQLMSRWAPPGLPRSQRFHVALASHGNTAHSFSLAPYHPHLYGVGCASAGLDLLLTTTMMLLPRHIYTLVFAFLLQGGAGAASEQSVLTGGLTHGLGTKAQVQDVLEHKPVTQPSCKQFVRILSLANRMLAYVCDSPRDP
jgi:hypothetical protein